MTKKVLFSFCLILALSFSTATAVNNQADLQAALNDTSIPTIVISNDFELTSALTMPVGRSVTLQSGNPNGVVIRLAEGNTARHIHVYNTGNYELNFIDVELRGRKDEGQTGGGVEFLGGNLTLSATNTASFIAAERGNITNNLASNWGGGVDMSSGILSGNLVISENQTSILLAGWIGGGGGVYAKGSIEIKDNVVISNNESIEAGGGGIRVTGDITIMDNVIISGNRASNASSGGIGMGGEGGGILAEGSYGSSFSNVTISDNVVISGNSSFRSGGGIFTNGDVKISDNVEISNNTANSSGGGIMAVNWDLERESDFTISGNVVISGNTALLNGGGIQVHGGDGITISDNVEISDNTANSSGGGIFTNQRGGDVKISDNVKISGNTARSSAGVHSSNGNVIITNNVEISGNISGGGVFISNGNITISEDAVISRNTGGFGIYASGSNVAVTISDNVVISDNIGGGIWSQGDVTLSGNVEIRNNMNGSGITSWGNTTINDNVIIIGNTGSVGGGIYQQRSNEYITKLTINDDVVISGNTGNSGGGIYSAGSNVDINGNVTISGNTTLYGGGGIHAQAYAYNNDPVTTVTINNNVIVSGNTANQFGGGIYSNCEVLISDNAVISGNTAQAGGGIWISDLENLKVNGNVTFIENIADNAYRISDEHRATGGLYERNITRTSTSVSVTGLPAPYNEFIFNNFDVNYRSLVVTFDANGGESTLDYDYLIIYFDENDWSMSYTIPANFSDNFTKQGYIITGWAVEGACTQFYEMYGSELLTEWIMGLFQETGLDMEDFEVWTYEWVMGLFQETGLDMEDFEAWMNEWVSEKMNELVANLLFNDGDTLHLFCEMTLVAQWEAEGINCNVAIPLNITISPTSAVTLTSEVPAIFTEILSKGFQYRLRGTETWTSIPTPDSFTTTLNNLPTNTYEVRAYVESSECSTLYSRMQQVMVICDCD